MNVEKNQPIKVLPKNSLILLMFNSRNYILIKISYLNETKRACSEKLVIAKDEDITGFIKESIKILYDLRPR
jgi:hypothetical protein